MGQELMQYKFIPNYTFEMRIGICSMSFSKITNLSSELEYETIGNGGNNDRMYFFNKPNRKPDTIIFEKGLRVSATDVIFSLITEGVKVNNIMIFVKRGSTTEKIFWIDQAIVIKKSYSNLDALGKEIMMKKLEMAHTGLVEFDV